MRLHRLALIPGHRIGSDVVEAAWKVGEAVAAKETFRSPPSRHQPTRIPWSCEFYAETGGMTPANGIETLRGLDAILLGAVGWPARVPDSVSLHRLSLPICKSFVQYANVRPDRPLPGVEGPLKPESSDILCIRENTEGDYSGAGGRVHRGGRDEVAVGENLRAARPVF